MRQCRQKVMQSFFQQPEHFQARLLDDFGCSSTMRGPLEPPSCLAFLLELLLLLYSSCFLFLSCHRSCCCNALTFFPSLFVSRHCHQLLRSVHNSSVVREMPAICFSAYCCAQCGYQAESLNDLIIRWRHCSLSESMGLPVSSSYLRYASSIVALHSTGLV